MPQKKGLPQSVMNAVSGGPLHSKQGYFDPEKYQLQEEVTVTEKLPSRGDGFLLFSQEEAFHRSKRCIKIFKVSQCFEIRYIKMEDRILF